MFNLGFSILLALMATGVQASHFRYGQITWERVSGMEVRFTVRFAWKSSNVGTESFKYGDGATTTLSGGASGCGGSFSSTGCSSDTSANKYYRLDSTNSDVSGGFYKTVTYIFTKTYTSEGPFTAYISSCCRVSGLLVGSGQSYRVWAVVDMRGGNSGSPVAPVQVILQYPIGQTTTIPLNPLDPDRSVVTCRAATTTESKVSSNANQIEVVTSDCQVTVSMPSTRTAGNKWVSQVVMMTGSGDAVALDFIIEAINPTNLPQCDVVTWIPAGGLTAMLGRQTNVTLRADVINGTGPVTISTISVPSGLTVSPLGSNVNTPANVTLSFTPTSLGTAVASVGVIKSGATRTCSVSFLTVNQTVGPSLAPTLNPTRPPTDAPSRRPSLVPSQMPTSTPTLVPSAHPSSSPSASPTALPSVIPTWTPSSLPSHFPSASPSTAPSFTPSSVPSHSPSASPSVTPSLMPSSLPSRFPSANPSIAPSSMPSMLPSYSPSASPSSPPSSIPSHAPSYAPSGIPSTSPSTVPSAAPSGNPSSNPTSIPSWAPSSLPSESPSSNPTSAPSGVPSRMPSQIPSDSPSSAPSSPPTKSPTQTPSQSPTIAPSTIPTSFPSQSPTRSPTRRWFVNQTRSFVINMTLTSHTVSPAELFGNETRRGQVENAMFIAAQDVMKNRSLPVPSLNDVRFKVVSVNGESVGNANATLGGSLPSADGYTINLSIRATTVQALWAERLRNHSMEISERFLDGISQLWNDSSVTAQTTGVSEITLDQPFTVAVESPGGKAVNDLNPLILIVAATGLAACCACASIIYVLMSTSSALQLFGAKKMAMWVFLVFNTYSDIAFVWLLEQCKFTLLFSLALVFVVLRLLSSFVAWHRLKWDEESFREYYNTYGISFIFWSCVFGSTFSTYFLATTGAFGLNALSMDVIEFEQIRFWYTILLGDLPQLGVQMAFFMTGGVWNWVTICAMSGTVVSILIGVFDCTMGVVAVDDSEKEGELDAPVVGEARAKITRAVSDETEDEPKTMRSPRSPLSPSTSRNHRSPRSPRSARGGDEAEMAQFYHMAMAENDDE